MLDAKKAYEIVKTHNPKMKALTCTEEEKTYTFSLIPKDLNEKDLFANSAVYTVNKKTGEYGQHYFMEMANETIIRSIDVTTLE